MSKKGFIHKNLLRNDENIIYQPDKSIASFFIAVLLCYPLFIGIFIGKLGEIKDFFTTDVLMTNQRVLGKWGVTSIHTMEIGYHEIGKIVVEQGFFGEKMDYGTVIFYTYHHGIFTFSGIKSPYEFKKLIERVINQIKEFTDS